MCILKKFKSYQLSVYWFNGIHPPKFMSTQNFQRITLFANRVFADRIKLWSYYVTVDPHLMTSVSIRKQNTEKHREEVM